MIDYEFQDLFTKQDVDKQLLIQYDTGQFTNHEIHSEQFTLEESLCSDNNLRFGSCEASSVKFTVSNVFEPLKDKWLDISMTLAGNVSNPFKFGHFKVYSDVPTADRKKREIMAYDALYDIINADVTEWYDTILPEKNSTVTLKQFRNSFFTHFGIEQEAVELPNDGMTVEKTIEPEQLSGKTVVSAICEINGCFGHINRDGKFRYVFLKPINHAIFPSPTLFPSPSLYPVKENGTRITSSKIIPPVKYEDFETDLITGLVIRQEENDIGATAGGGENKYIIEDNFLVYGKNAEQLSEIANTVFNQINEIFYRPYEAKSVGNPCIEVGDILRIVTQNKIISSYALQRTLSGVQNLRDDFSADGEKQYAEKVNSLSSSIVQLKGKTNTLTRTVDETISELKDLENGTNTRFTQTSDEISALATRTTKNEQDITNVNIRADGISASIKEVDGKVDKNSTKIEANANALSVEVKRAKEAEANLSVRADEIKTSLENFEADTNSKFTQTSTEISTSVNDLRTETNSKFTQMSNKISLKVSTGDVINEINISDEAIKLSAGRLIITSGNFTLDKYGNCSMSGEINATSGTIGPLIISPNGLVLGEFGSGSELGFLSNEELSINRVSTPNLDVDFISSPFASGIKISSDVVINADLEADSADFRMVDASYISTTNLDVISQFSATDIYCDSLNNGIPVTSANLWEYMPEITFTVHASGGMNGAYYYSTDSTYASGDNKSIPSIQWVKNYTNSKVSSYVTDSDLSSYAKKTLVTSLQNDIDSMQLTVSQNADDISSLLSRVSALESAI